MNPSKRDILSLLALGGAAGLSGAARAGAKPAAPLILVLRDRYPTTMSRIALSACFVFLASFSVSQISAQRLAELDLAGWARLISSASVIGFLIMIAWLTIVRPAPVARAGGIMPRAAAVLGTWLFLIGSPFLARRGDLGAPLLLAGALVTLVGEVLTLLFLRWLGRSFSIAPEARKLVTSGPYRIVRHPLYAAELLAMIGIVLQFASLEAAAITSLWLRSVVITIPLPSGSMSTWCVRW